MQRAGKYFAVIAILLQIFVCYSQDLELNETINFSPVAASANALPQGTYTLDKPTPNSIKSSLWDPLYFWQRFTGFIPQNAVKGGNNCPNGTDAYIGSTVFFNVQSTPTLPSIICPGDPYVNAFYMYDPVKTEATKHTHILCATKQPQWIPVDMHYIPDHCYPILAGSQQLGPVPLFIGRVNIKGVYYFGKVRTTYGLVFWYENEEQNLQSFELLAYCEEKKV